MSTKETEGVKRRQRGYKRVPFLPLNLGGDVDEGDRGGKKETEGYKRVPFLPLNLGGDVDKGDRGGKKETEGYKRVLFNILTQTTTNFLFLPFLLIS
jgi:hypothetical protein